MEHVSIDSGTAGIFDDVDKSDFKADFSSEFPVGLPLILCMPVMLLVPVAAVAIATECPSMPQHHLAPAIRSQQPLTSSPRCLCVSVLPHHSASLLCDSAAPLCCPACPPAHSRSCLCSPSCPLPQCIEHFVLQQSTNKCAELPTCLTLRTPTDAICFSSDSFML